MAIADREVPVSQGDIFTRHPVLSRLHHDAVHHGVGLVAVIPQIQSVVPLALFRERVRPDAEGEVTTAFALFRYESKYDDRLLY